MKATAQLISSQTPPSTVGLDYSRQRKRQMAEKYKYCPYCQQPLEDNGSCPGCSYGHKHQKAKSQDQPRLCAWNDHGMSCHLPGHLSQTVHGTGPWYCRSHFAQIMGWPALTATVTEPGANG